MQKCTSFLRLSASLPDKWLMPAMSIQKLVVRAVNAESALEKAAAMMPMVKNISTANPRWPSAANKGKVKDNVNKYLKKLTEQWEELPPHFVSSSEKKTGRQEILDYIDSINRSLKA
jgi:hypothetical protein